MALDRFEVLSKIEANPHFEFGWPPKETFQNQRLLIYYYINFTTCVTVSNNDKKKWIDQTLLCVCAMPSDTLSDWYPPSYVSFLVYIGKSV